MTKKKHRTSRKRSIKPKVRKPVDSPPLSGARGYAARLGAFVSTPKFAKFFAAACLTILALTTVFWTVLAAKLHQANADQLIDAYLFENWQTFRSAVFPGAHSFLIKWPIFALMSLFGNSLGVFMVSTVLIVLATVGGLVYVLHKIEKRPVAFGLLCLALSSVLLLVPAQPYAGALLPVNMAMTTTRNLEYILYIAALYWAVRARRIRSGSFVFAAVLSILLIASDKLFAVLGIGGGLFACVWYVGWMRRRQILKMATRWLTVVVPGAVVATGLLLVLDSLGITHIGAGETASPFPLIHSVQQLALGLIYGVMALLTNFGANPVHSVVMVRDLPAAALASLSHLSIAAYAVNLAILGIGLYATVRLILTHRTNKGSDAASDDHWLLVSVLLIGSTLTAGAVFVLTDHYYPVDARYLTIGLFALGISGATYFRGIQPRNRYVAITALILLAVLPIGLQTSWHEYRASEAALVDKNFVTNRVSQELQRHYISRLIGDYWDITPIKARAASPITINPVDQCTMPRSVLNSAAWFKQSRRTPTAYLAVKDPAPPVVRGSAKQISTYGGCSLAHIAGSYGVPSERVAIGQTTTSEIQDTPDVLLLLYPDGIKPAPRGQSRQAAGGRPDMAPPKLFKAVKTPEIKPLVAITERDVCARGITLQIVAHQDDDLLFMNPDVSASIKDGRCMRTVYLTAGDAGEGINYWGGREQGAMAAYAQMYGVPNVWHKQQQTLAGRKASVVYLADVPEVALIFLRLPDGNLGGEGFVGHDHESLHGVMSGAIPVVHSVDGVESYTKQQLVDALLEIMVKDQPDQIRTQGSGDPADGDHADHHDVGILTAQAAEAYRQPHTLMRYLGYPNKLLPVNLSDDFVTTKLATFMTYAKFDGAVCQTAFECQGTYTYGSYLTRQYQPGIAAAP